MEQDDVSPLQHFVVAKRTISAMFQQMLEYVREGSDFVEGKMINYCICDCDFHSLHYIFSN